MFVERDHGVAGGGERVLELRALGLALVEQVAGAARAVADGPHGLGEIGAVGRVERRVAGRGRADCLCQPPPRARADDRGCKQQEQAGCAERDPRGHAPAALRRRQRRSDPDQRGEQRDPRGRPQSHRSNR